MYGHEANQDQWFIVFWYYHSVIINLVRRSGHSSNQTFQDLLNKQLQALLVQVVIVLPTAVIIKKQNMDTLHKQRKLLFSVLSAFGFKENTMIEPIGNGLINKTWKVTGSDQDYILQQVNQSVFETPEHIAHNIRAIATYLQGFDHQYRFVAPIVSTKGNELEYLEDEGYFRLFPFVTGSHSINVVGSAKEAYEAAAQFGRFTKLLAGFDIGKLKITIPDFHHLSLRYFRFQQALRTGDHQRRAQAQALINTLILHNSIVKTYEWILTCPDFKLRVTHHDTKISNVLFDEQNMGICVIDLDTVMPGYFISDVGDMMRTYLSPVNEEEGDFTKILIRDDFYKAIVQGYYSEMKEKLTPTEKQYFFFAGKFMIYMQALRFMTDYLNNDVYYGASYSDHNLIRATNQVVLLQRLIEKEKVLSNIEL